MSTLKIGRDVSVQQLNLVRALRQGVITWFQYFEEWRRLEGK